MTLVDLKRARRLGSIQRLDIITHSCLGRYSVQVIPQGQAAQPITDAQGQPLFWRSLGDVRSRLCKIGFCGVALQVRVPQDEVIGR